MKSIYIDKIKEENLAQYLPQVNLSDRDKEIVTTYLEGGVTYRDLGVRYDISGERVRQIIERFARKAHHYYKKALNTPDC
jgi:DNA-directed RNA polymerase sigma subunit (sigma70/sigma32)